MFSRHIIVRGATALTKVDCTVNSTNLPETAHDLYLKDGVFSKIMQDAITLPLLKFRCKKTNWRPAASPYLSLIENIQELIHSVERAALENTKNLIRSVLEIWTTITEQYGTNQFRLYLDIVQ